MDCLYCANKTRVVDTVAYNGNVFRRRRCLECGEVFYTKETHNVDYDMVKEAFAYKQNKHKGEQNG